MLAPTALLKSQWTVGLFSSDVLGCFSDTFNESTIRLMNFLGSESIINQFLMTIKAINDNHMKSIKNRKTKHKNSNVLNARIRSLKAWRPRGLDWIGRKLFCKIVGWVSGWSGLGRAGGLQGGLTC